MMPIALLVFLAATAFAAVVPAPVAYRNLTLLDGTIKTVELPAGIQFVSTANATADSSSSGHEKRLSWHPGSENDECETNQYYHDKTSNGSPNVADCKWIADVESLPDNQVSKSLSPSKAYKNSPTSFLFRATSRPSPSRTTPTTATGAA